VPSNEIANDTADRAADRLHSAAIHLLRLLREEDVASGVSAARLSALSVVVFAGPVTLGRLAEAEQVRPPTISGIVAGLERDGLVERRPDAHDGRVQWVHSTPKGRRLLSRARGRRIEAFASRLRDLSDEELATLERAAELIERAVSRQA
jgi:DNA-binding MarR family transcriptional regulator